MLVSKERALLAIISIVSTLGLWIVFNYFVSFGGIKIPEGGMNNVFANYDGPLYIVVAKTWYDFSQGNRFEFPLPNEYYAAHFPLYPALISLFSWLTSSTWAMVLITLIGSVGSVWAFNELARKYIDRDKAFWLSLIFLFFPARYLTVRSIGSPEPLFIMFIILSLTTFVDKKYWLAGIFGALATLTKSPGILLFISYMVYALVTRTDPVKRFRKYLPLLLIPLGLLGLFSVYKIQYGDFLAYFHSGDNIHLNWLPFQIFDSTQPWVGTFWLEEVIWIYAAGLFGLIRLARQKRYELAVFLGVFLTTIFFVSHRDVTRYALPMVPLILLALGESLVLEKKFRWVYVVLLVPIFLYSLNFMANNVMPIADWGKLL